jgi:hypothetical protein
VQIDQSQDYRAWDNTEPVTYLRNRRATAPVDGGGQYRKGETQPPYTTAGRLLAADAIPVPVAKRRNVQAQELAASAGAYQGSDQVWLLPQAVLLPGLVPALGDAIQDAAGNRWTCISLTAGKRGQTWRLTCRNLTIAYALQDLVSVERPGISYDLAGVPTKAWPSGPGPRGGEVVYQNVPCRVQPKAQELQDERAVQGFTFTHEIVLSQELALTWDDRLKWGSLYLDVTGYRQVDQVDQLPIVEAVIQP